MKVGIYVDLIANRYKILNFDNTLKVNKIYQAYDTYKNKKVLLKIIKHNPKNIYPDFIEELIDEITVFKQIKSPFFCPIIDVGILNIDYEPYYYIINSFFDGISLDSFIKNNIIPTKEIFNILNNILKALDTLNANNYYHGSLCLDNILIDYNYNIKIMDCCIVKANKGENPKLNNLKFLAPEQLSINYTDFQSDFYSLGLILFNLMFKKMPYEVSEDEATMLKFVDKGISWDEFYILSEDKNLFLICKKLLSRKNKYTSVKEIIIDVSDIIYEKAKVQKPKLEEQDKKQPTKDEKVNKSSKTLSVIIAVLIVISTILTTILMF